MQKSFAIILIVAVIGAFAIFQIPAVPAYAAFIIGMVLATLVMSMSSTTTATAATQESDGQYSGPTMTLYVGNLPYRVHEGEVKALFGEYGPVNSVRLVRDRKTGRRKGFGFVEMSESGAKKAMNKLNDFSFQERTLKVREAKTQDNEAKERNTAAAVD
ncbi:RNA recognition motif domain-containing protein [Shewanella gelidii]|uniref:RNA-binding protein n=1 Tax=Shewanella gelidii TaxID=1642821 RepID=A0A917JW71_9GAMM|nr:RNA-binding protein [Shewanella gelidii]MCL1098844.1 RNA-binding protein [Shewanella gelidii]GGI89321.1 RNA-binding protein [Shewanella gelidii]